MKLCKVPTLFGAMFLLAASAAPAYAGKAVQAATRGGVFHMPAGVRTGLSAKQELQTKVPVGDKALVALKNQGQTSGAEEAESQTVEEPWGGNAAAVEPLFASSVAIPAKPENSVFKGTRLMMAQVLLL